jgi:hypothetical protein
MHDAKWRGYSRLEHETVREAVQRWSIQGDWLVKEEMNSLLLLFEKAKYSGLQITGEELSEMTQILLQLREEAEGSMT